jgi:hypothetical protein
MTGRKAPRAGSRKLSVEEADARAAQAPTSLKERLQDRAEMWIYALNERQHPIFRAYDAFNEAWARLVFHGLRRRAAAFTRDLADHDCSGTLRLLGPDDLEAFAALLAAFEGFRYGPPHPLDRHTAERCLRRASHLAFGIFQEGKLVGYVLLRLFFPRRVVTGIWMRREHQSTGAALAAVKASRVFTQAEHIPDYVTVPIDNYASLMGAQNAGWRVVRSNRRFHVLLR